jgi:hypothetical protein
MAVKTCPHCGLNAWFQADDVCPSCHIRHDDPVTPRDHERIAQIARRPGPRPAAIAAGATMGTGVTFYLLIKLTFLLVQVLGPP